MNDTNNLNVTHLYVENINMLSSEEVNNISNGSIIFNAVNDDLYIKFNDTLTKILDKDLSELNNKLNNNIKKEIDPVLGIVMTGEFDSDGAVLEWVDRNFNKVEGLTAKNYFDKHPSFKFEDLFIGTDEMVRIPLCYWWKGYVPRGEFKDKWCMMISPIKDPGIEGITFIPNYSVYAIPSPGVFRPEYLTKSFAISKYSVRVDSNEVPHSTVSINSLNGIIPDARVMSYNDVLRYLQNKEKSFHLQTYQEYQEILARMVLEFKTFKIDLTTDYNKTFYRGIADINPNGWFTMTVGVTFYDGLYIPKYNESDESHGYYVLRKENNYEYKKINFEGIDDVKKPTHYPTELLTHADIDEYQSLVYTFFPKSTTKTVSNPNTNVVITNPLSLPKNDTDSDLRLVWRLYNPYGTVYDSENSLFLTYFLKNDETNSYASFRFTYMSD